MREQILNLYDRCGYLDCKNRLNKIQYRPKCYWCRFIFIQKQKSRL